MAMAMKDESEQPLVFKLELIGRSLILFFIGSAVIFGMGGGVSRLGGGRVAAPICGTLEIALYLYATFLGLRATERMPPAARALSLFSLILILGAIGIGLLFWYVGIFGT